MKIAACHVLREQSSAALLATSQFAFCAQSSKGMKKQAVGKQENVLLLESPLTEMSGFTTFWPRHVEISYSWSLFLRAKQVVSLERQQILRFVWVVREQKILILVKYAQSSHVYGKSQTRLQSSKMNGKIQLKSFRLEVLALWLSLTTLVL